MPSDVERAVAGYSASHHGVFGSAVLHELGATRRFADNRVANGRWVRLYEGVFRLAGAPRTWRGELLAACLAAGPCALASHRSAAELWKWPGGRTDFVEITCPRWRRGQEAGPVIHESKALDPADRCVVDNIPVTSPGLTLLMLGAVASPLTVEMALDVALRQGHVTYASLRALLRRVGRRGRNGAGVLRTIVNERAPDRGVPESPMETKLLRLVRELGFPPPIAQYEVRHEGSFYGRLDAAWPDRKVGIEYDSYEHHTGKLALVRDNARRDALRAIEWRIVVATAEDLKDRGARIAPLLHQALRSGVRDVRSEERI
jgi:hypothetical protein